MKKSPTDGMKTSTHPAMMPARVIGTVTLQKARHLPAPKSRAASVSDGSSLEIEL